eukprot:3940877-Rhodomonas_salina.5
MLCAYAHATRSPVLTKRITCATRTAERCPSRVCYSLRRPGISLDTRYAKSGTDLARALVGLRACYAMSGTDLAYGATRPILCATEITCQVSSAVTLRAR